MPDSTGGTRPDLISPPKEEEEEEESILELPVAGRRRERKGSPFLWWFRK